ncbi:MULTISPECIES: hypothetical protein [unclassified Paenibacillus]|uniref:hypothetical protein n=1 Tax=unclassified Paenibacillus TaxID=185978 RepID=UPI001C106BA9|nr:MULTISPECIES: hypothetical protein [unclassified Paenibacillus]MBU5442042.1 hypothetical protein [Paenibacillus sp. MSJ-34]CAH0120474.1 hypothetical protein PAE9249_02993 [Paenibacillus sp. CECT 9249]
MKTVTAASSANRHGKERADEEAEGSGDFAAAETGMNGAERGVARLYSHAAATAGRN